MKKSINFFFVFLLGISTFLMVSCGKDQRVPPELIINSGRGFVSTDTTLGRQDTIKVSITANKTEDELKTFNVSYSYDNGMTTTFLNEVLTKSQNEHYEKVVTIVTRNVAGTEKWLFTITDRDGNITTKQIVVTVL